jgi:hypothetical protein
VHFLCIYVAQLLCWHVKESNILTIKLIGCNPWKENYCWFVVGVLEQCRQGGAEAMTLLSQLASRNSWGSAGATLNTVRQHVQSLAGLAERLEGRATPHESVAESVEGELASMEKAIEEAASKIEVFIC